MTDRDDELPEFVREALDDGPTDGAAELGRLPELLSPLAPGERGLGRLMQAVAEPPLTYAPFFDRLGRLWDLPEARVVQVLERSRDEREWRRAPLPGLKLLRLDGGPRAADANCYLAHFAPGLTFPEHRHRGHESVLLLEGSSCFAHLELARARALRHARPEHVAKIDAHVLDARGREDVDELRLRLGQVDLDEPLVERTGGQFCAQLLARALERVAFGIGIRRRSRRCQATFPGVPGPKRP